MRCSFSDPELTETLFDLLEVVFPGLREGAIGLRRLGARWEEASTPFVHFVNGTPVAHIGVIEIPLVLLGHEVTVGSIHAVATHPGHRRRGYYRQLMEEVLEYCDTRYKTLILTTENPEYYEPFGFRVLQEHRFDWSCPGVAASDGLRRVNLKQVRDIELLDRLLENREPVSRVAGVTGAKAVFCFNEAHRPLYYAEDLDVLISMELTGSRLELFDIVGAELPALEAVVARLPQPVDEVTAFFSLDRFEVSADAAPHVLDHDGPSYLMARGPFAAETKPFMLPRSART